MDQRKNFVSVSMDEIVAQGITAQKNPRNPVVLVVDDEVLIADTLTKILAQHGIAAMTAYDGFGALEIARIIPPDLLLADVVMPGMSGIELAMAMQQDITDCKILLFSGQAATAGLLAKAGKAWCDFEVLLKPIHPEKLVKVIFERLRIDVGKQPAERVQQSSNLRMNAAV